MSSSFAGAEMTTFACSRLDMSFRIVGIREEAGRLDHNIDCLRLPGDLAWLLLGENGDLLAVDGETLVARSDLCVVAAVRRVVGEKRR